VKQIIKGAGGRPEEGARYVPWWGTQDKFNHFQHRNTQSRRQQHQQLFFRQL